MSTINIDVPIAAPQSAPVSTMQTKVRTMTHIPGRHTNQDQEIKPDLLHNYVYLLAVTLFIIP